MKYKHGFTLIELMITVAIVGVLAAVAYPAYTDSILKGRRAQARTALLDLMQQQERYMTQFNCYLPFSTNSTLTATATAGCDGKSSSAPASVPFKVFAGENSSNAAYRLSASACSVNGSNRPLNECIELTATPLKSDPAAGSLVITSNGAKSCTGTAASTNKSLCWP